MHSAKQAAFLFFYRVLEGAGRGAGLLPGALEWTLVPEGRLGEEKYMQWTAPGLLGTYVFVLCIRMVHEHLGMCLPVTDLAKVGT